MKSFASACSPVLAAALSLAAVPAVRADDVSPGWQSAGGPSRAALTGLLIQGQMPTAPQNTPPSGTPSPAPASTSEADLITPEIQALADGLRHDPRLIYQYCHDRIRHECYWGSKKGAALTLLEGSGNCFDTSSLMVALLKASGTREVEYRYGIRFLYRDEARFWLGLLDPISDDGIPYPQFSNAQLLSYFNQPPGTTVTNELRYDLLVTNFLSDRGYPFVWTDALNDSYIIPHVWVRFRTAADSLLEMDPTVKKVARSMASRVRPTATQISYNHDAFLVGLGGTAVGTTGISGLSAPALGTQLGACTGGVLSWLNGSYHGSSVESFIYSGAPAQLASSFTLAGQSLIADWDYSTSTAQPLPLASWSAIPTQWETKVTFTFGSGYDSTTKQFANTFATIALPANQLRGRTLSLSSESSVLSLRADETALLSITLADPTVQLRIAVDHPFGALDNAGTFTDDGDADQVEVKTYQTSGTYAIIYGFDPSAARQRLAQKRLDAYRAANLTESSWQVRTATLDVMGQDYLMQVTQADRILGTLGKTLVLGHHFFGRMAQESAYYIDMGLNMGGCLSYAANFPMALSFRQTTAHFGSALEHGIIEQLQGPQAAAVSTARIAALANQQGRALHLASSTNWTTVRTALDASGTWPTATLDSIGADLAANTTARSLLPTHADIGLTFPVPTNQWRGYGYNFLGDKIEGMFISGGYSGGYSSSSNATVSPSTLTYYQQNAPSYQQSASGLVQSAYQPLTTPTWTAADPVDMATGAFTSNVTDLQCGGAIPRGLAFSRIYNSNRSGDDSPGLGYGWTHNLDIRATRRSPSRAAWGETTPQQMAATYAALYIAFDIYLKRADAKDYAATALIADWAVNRIRDGSVSIQSGGSTLEFVQMPDGTFVSPAGITSTLAQGTGGVLTLTERHGNTYLFNANGFLASVTDPHGKTATFAYIPHTSGSTTKTVLSTVTDCYDRVLTLGWVNGKIQTVTETAGPLTRAVIFGYTDGILETVTDPEDSVTTYRYDTQHRLDRITDGRQRVVVENIYDAEGRVTHQRLHGPPASPFKLFFNGMINTERNPAGGETSYHYDTRGRGTGITDATPNTDATRNRSYIAYDGQDRQTATANPSNNTATAYRPTYTAYNADHNPVTTVLPERDTTDTTTTAQRTITREYDAQKRLWKQWDLKNHFTETTYTDQHQIYQIKDRKDQLILTNTYNTDGTLLFTTDAANQTTEYLGYDSYGYPQTIKHPAVTVNGASVRPTETFLYNARGDLLEHTDSNGNLTSTTYNDRRQPLVTTHPTVDAITATTEITYDAAGNPDAARDARGNWTYTDISQTGKTLTVKLPPTPAGNPVITSHYNNRDWLDWTKDPAGNTTSFLHDLAGRVTQATDPLARDTNTDYNADGQPFETRDGREKPTTTSYNWRGEAWQTTNPLNHTTTTGLDDNGNPDTITNKRGKLYDFTFDANDRQTLLETPLHKSYSSDYTTRGLLDYAQEPSTDRATNLYDAMGRPETTTHTRGSTTHATLAREYDKQGNLKKLTVTTSAPATTRTLTYSAYDARNRLRTFIDARGNSIGYRYDAAGNLTELIYPGSIGSVHYTYDTHNRLETVTDWANRTTRYHYTLTGQISRTQHANGTQRRHAIDAAGQPSGISELNAANQPIYYSINRHDAAGRRDQEITNPAPHAHTPPPFAATYDDDNRLLTVNLTATVVDEDGNLTTGPIKGGTGGPPVFETLAYNTRNQLLSAAGLAYTYDPGGNRIGVTDTSGETQWTIDSNASLSRALVREKPGGLKTYYIYGLGLLYEINGTATTTYHYDNRGNTVALSAANGTTILDRIEYSPYGTETWRQGAYDTPFRFCGAFGVQTDPNGLLNMRARYYSPYLMRFLNADPIGFSGGSNWFAYADGNPISLSDPFGLFSWWGLAKAVGGGLEAAAGVGLAAAASWTGIGAVAGVAVAAHGIDTMQAGLRQAFTDQQVDTGTSQLIQATTGASRETANLVDAGIGIVGSAGAGTWGAALRWGEVSVPTVAAGLSTAERIAMYEVGQKTLERAPYIWYAGRFPNEIERGMAIVAEQGWAQALKSQGSGKWLGIGETFGTGPTPAGWLGVGALGSILETLGYGNTSGNTSGNK